MIDIVPQPAVEAAPMVAQLAVLIVALLVVVGLPVLAIWLLYGRSEPRHVGPTRAQLRSWRANR